MLNMRSPLDGFRSPFGPRRGDADPDAVISALFASGEIGAWYDPSDISTLWKDTAGTDPVTTAGDAVARIDDKSGNGFNLTQATLASRPLYQLDGALPYLSFDGTDDSMLTATITPGIDKVQVFAGVRKAIDAATGMVVELSAAVVSNAGSFVVYAPSTPSANYLFRGRGSSAQTDASYTNAAIAAPVTNVLTGLGDIAGDSLLLRVNGTQVASSVTDQGTGNYLAYPLYVGRRGGTTQPFNGRLYSLIVRFGANLTADQITDAETWVNGKTGAF